MAEEEKYIWKIVIFREMDPLLKQAAVRGDVEFLDATASDPRGYLRLPTDKGHNIFHIAVRFGRTAFIRKAIEMLPKIDLHNLLNHPEPTLGWNPLHLAAFQGNPRVIQLLVQVFTPPPPPDHGGVAVVMNYCSIPPAKAVDKDGNTPLHLLLRKPANHDDDDDLEECARALQIWSSNNNNGGFFCQDSFHNLFSLALQNGFTTLAEEMLDFSSQFKLTNLHGFNALQILDLKSSGQFST